MAAIFPLSANDKKSTVDNNLRILLRIKIPYQTEKICSYHKKISIDIEEYQKGDLLEDIIEE